MDSLSSKMDEADQHLDRLGGILRSLRAPPPDRSSPSNTANVGRKRPAHQRQHQQLRDWQQQQQQQQQDREQEERQLLCASGSSRSRTASLSSQTETMTMAPPLSRREHQEAARGSVHKGPPAPQQYQRLGYKDEDLRTASISGNPSAPSSTVSPVVQPGDVDANEVSTKAPLPSPLRKRAVRTWWRGLSCGVCFAAGAWAREGHGVYGALLALVAVCAETMLC